jgi:hypothetical protein
MKHYNIVPNFDGISLILLDSGEMKVKSFQELLKAVLRRCRIKAAYGIPKGNITTQHDE